MHRERKDLVTLQLLIELSLRTAIIEHGGYAIDNSMLTSAKHVVWLGMACHNDKDGDDDDDVS